MNRLFVAFCARRWRATVCAVFEAETLQRGLLEAATRKPDLIILDLGLPDGDGIEFIRDLRQWSAVPVIVLSARSERAIKSPRWMPERMII